jgi:hypothetical protein
MSATIGVANWGPLVCGYDIDDVLLDAMRQWAPTYLKQINTERSLAFQMAVPRTYGSTFAGQEFLDHQLPAVIVMTSILTATRGGADSTLEGTWQTRVATVTRGKTPPQTKFLASLYEGVFRRLLLQRARGAPVNSMHYLGMRYEEVPSADGSGRYCLAAISNFEVYSDQIVRPFGGPDVPDADEYVGEATVTEVDIEVLGDTLPPITSGPGG